MVGRRDGLGRVNVLAVQVNRWWVKDSCTDAEVSVVWLVFAGGKDCKVKTVRLLPFVMSDVETC